MSRTKDNKPSKKSPFYTFDGRINPDKAIAHVTKVLKSMTPEQVRKIASTPVILRGSDGKPLKKQKPD